jgi:hypothetical protein
MISTTTPIASTTTYTTQYTTITPVPIDVSVVTFTARLDMSIDDFNSTYQENYKESIAKGLVIDVATIDIVSVSQFTLRRLLSTMVDVTTAITVSTENATSLVEVVSSNVLQLTIITSPVISTTVSVVSTILLEPDGLPIPIVLVIPITQVIVTQPDFRMNNTTIITCIIILGIITIWVLIEEVGIHIFWIMIQDYYFTSVYRRLNRRSTNRRTPQGQR